MLLINYVIDQILKGTDCSMKDEINELVARILKGQGHSKGGGGGGSKGGGLDVNQTEDKDLWMQEPCHSVCVCVPVY